MIGYINGKPVEFEENETILSTASRHNHFIPTLCEMTNIDHTPGTCRVCLVDIKRKNQPDHHVVTACTTPMEEEIEVLTRTPEVRKMQRLQLELILADHNQDCASCIRHGNCELQDAAQFVGLSQTRYHYPGFYLNRSFNDKSSSIVRDMSKCIRCFRCLKVCREYQGMDALVVNNKGLETEIDIKDSFPSEGSHCVNCGQCTLVCPVAGISEKDDIEKVLDHLYNLDCITVFQFAPAVRVALGEEFDIPPGTNVEGLIVSALKHLGADIVLDTNFAADLVVMEEGTEFMHRLRDNAHLPMFTSCCPAWVTYIEKNYPEFLPNLSTTKSPQQCLGAIAKNFLAEKLSLDSSKIKVISIMPCTAKKEEASSQALVHQEKPDVDVVITTREFARLLKRENIKLGDLEPSDPDNKWMGEYSGAGVIFGSSSGVMEAAIRTLYYLTEGEELPSIEYQTLRGDDSIREASIELKGTSGPIRAAVIHTLKQAKKLLEEMRSGKTPYHFVEVMTCPGGCICGGGQPRAKASYQTHSRNRKEGIYQIDSKKSVRQAHNNPMIKKLYEEYLKEPMGEKSHQLLHRQYKNRHCHIKHTMQQIWSEIQDS